MKAVYIYPEDIGASGYWSVQWEIFIKKLGWEPGTRVWECALVVPIQTED